MSDIQQKHPHPDDIAVMDQSAVPAGAPGRGVSAFTRVVWDETAGRFQTQTCVVVADPVEVKFSAKGGVRVAIVPVAADGSLSVEAARAALALVKGHG